MSDLPSYSAEHLAANFPTRTDASILSGPYTPTYIAAQQIERLRAYAVALENAAHDALGFADGIASTTGNTFAARIADHLRTALTNDPAQPALGSLSSPQLCDCDPEGTCGHPGDRNYRCVKEAIDRGDPDVVDSRHQSGRDVPDDVRNMLLHSGRSSFLLTIDNVNADGSISCQIVPTPRATGYEQPLRFCLPNGQERVHQVGRNDELKTAATALYKWLLTVPHMDPPMARFSIPDEIWEPFQDALFDGAKP